MGLYILFSKFDLYYYQKLKRSFKAFKIPLSIITDKIILAAFTILNFPDLQFLESDNFDYIVSA